MTIIIPDEATDTKPTHVCPPWCVRDHTDDLPWRQYHSSGQRQADGNRDFTASLSRTTYTDPDWEHRTCTLVHLSDISRPRGGADLTPAQAVALVPVLRVLGQDGAAAVVSALIDELVADGAK